MKNPPNFLGHFECLACGAEGFDRTHYNEAYGDAVMHHRFNPTGAVDALGERHGHRDFRIVDIDGTVYETWRESTGEKHS